jgi:hypothetical protein
MPLNTALAALGGSGGSCAARHAPLADIVMVAVGWAGGNGERWWETP